MCTSSPTVSICVYQFSCPISVCQFSSPVSMCTSSPVLLLSVCTSSPVVFCVPVLLCCFYLCVPVLLTCFYAYQFTCAASICVYQFSCPVSCVPVLKSCFLVSSSQVLFLSMCTSFPVLLPVLKSCFLVYQFSTPISLCTRSPVPGHMPPLPVSPASSSSGSDTASMTEFRQVKLHAQNQILLLKVLSDEKEQVTMVVQHTAARSPFIPRIFVGYVDL